MKRMIFAAWNGIVPQSKLIELGIPRKDAKQFQDYLYENEYDSGFDSPEDMFTTWDATALYNEMKGTPYKNTSSDLDMVRMLSSELSGTGVECVGFNEGILSNKLTIDLQKPVYDYDKMRVADVIKTSLTLPAEVYRYNEQSLDWSQIVRETFNAISHM